jgi:hypothetical protein
MLIVANEPFVLKVIMLIIVMLNVVAPLKLVSKNVLDLGQIQ